MASSDAISSTHYVRVFSSFRYGLAIFSGAFGYLAAMYYATFVDILGYYDLTGDIGETEEIIPTYLLTRLYAVYVSNPDFFFSLPLLFFSSVFPLPEVLRYGQLSS